MLNAMCPMVAILPVQNYSGHDLRLRMAEELGIGTRAYELVR